MIRAITLIVLSLFSSSTFALSNYQIQTIQMGWHAPYSDITIDYVNQISNHQELVKSPAFKYKSDFDYTYKLPQSVLDEPAHPWMWLTLISLQLADIHSTHEGVKYDCIKEANPLLPSRPTLGEMASFKLAIMYPTYNSVGFENITNRELIFPIIFTAGIVANNYNVVGKARHRCSLR